MPKYFFFKNVFFTIGPLINLFIFFVLNILKASLKQFSTYLFDFEEFFPKEHIFSSSQVEHGKPAPDLFLFAAQNMGFKPEDCIVIEDSHLGIQGAKAANMRAIGFTGGSHAALLEDDYPALLKNAGAEAVIDDHSNLTKLLLP